MLQLCHGVVHTFLPGTDIILLGRARLRQLVPCSHSNNVLLVKNVSAWYMLYKSLVPELAGIHTGGGGGGGGGGGESPRSLQKFNEVTTVPAKRVCTLFKNALCSKTHRRHIKTPMAVSWEVGSDQWFPPSFQP